MSQCAWTSGCSDHRATAWAAAGSFLPGQDSVSSCSSPAFSLLSFPGAFAHAGSWSQAGLLRVSTGAPFPALIRGSDKERSNPPLLAGEAKLGGLGVQ